MKRSASRGLSQRITLAVLGYALLLTIAIAAHGYLVNEQAEQSVWESLLATEFKYFEQRKAQDPAYQWHDSETLQLYGALNSVPIPSEFAALPAGVHDEVVRDGKQFVLLVQGSEPHKAVMALDISELEENEHELTWTIVSSAIGMVMLLALATQVGVRKLVQPLILMAQDIGGLSPRGNGQSVSIPADAPHEAIVIVDALNEHLRRIDEFMERELAFVRMTSHELRTPIAVIAGAAEVALDSRQDRAASELHLHRILQTARDMEKLLVLLLVLARDPARLQASIEAIDLSELIPSIVQDHLFLAQSKELEFRLDRPLNSVVHAPAQIVRATIGNLLRNAIENSDRGVIEISAAIDGSVTIRDPGHGMSDEELSRIYTLLARSGAAPASHGIGLDLIGRVCEHLGWSLCFSSEIGQGTTTVLRLPATPGATARTDQTKR
ncbi:MULTISPECIES: HAMP domain-containing sensor histidine kinase [Hydrocarboniphaga]|jgi:signal transduction histidine kinase|uniref:sensor histidine kinase n=1 Tax=Hydrocarboniphaga TaxID=243627 RepID=UPI002AB8E119|nr:HAMP domain-containing sensor histidine kinase [Hydrocarboniphaga sp.]MDZ4077861.1 HAMP domain-containing sensor histidine kinase [Hydrocarboniphaga sp.]